MPCLRLLDKVGAVEWLDGSFVSVDEFTILTMDAVQAWIKHSGYDACCRQPMYMVVSATSSCPNHPDAGEMPTESAE